MSATLACNSGSAGSLFSCLRREYRLKVSIVAGVAQLVEQLICNQQVAGSSPIASSIKRREKTVEGFQSGQREQTVNLSSSTSVVQIHPPPPPYNLLAQDCLGCRRRKSKNYGVVVSLPDAESAPSA